MLKKRILALKNKTMLVYILSFSIIVVLIIGIMGSYLYHFFYKTILNDFKGTNRSYLMSILNRHENDMKSLEDISLQMGLAGSGSEFLLEESPEKSIALEEQLYRYTSVSQFFSQVIFFYHKDGYLYTPTTSVALERFFSQGFLLEKTKKEDLFKLLYQEHSGINVLPEQKINGYLTQYFHELLLNSVIYILPVEPKKNCTILFLVGSPYYDNLLSIEENDCRQTFLFWKDTPILSRGDLNVPLESISPEVSDVSFDQFEATLEGEQFWVTLSTGESGLTYCTIQPMKVFQDKIMSGQWGILFVLFLCSIPTSLAIVGLFYSLTRKVRKITSLLNENDDNYYNFQIIENGIRVLVETNKRVEKESLPFHRTRFVGTFIRNEYKTREEILAAGQRASLFVNHSYFAVILMGDKENSNENKTHEIMLTLLHQYEDCDGYGIHLINNNQSLFVVFGDFPSTMKQLFEELFTIGKKYCENFVMSISDFHSDFSHASNAYLEANAAFDNRFLMDNSRIIYFADVANKEQVDLLPDTYIQRLKNTIRSKNLKEAELVIKEICTCLKSKQQSLLTFRIFYNDMIHMMITEWNSNHVNFKNIYNVFSLSQCLTINDFSDILCEISRKLIESKQVTDTQISNVVTDAIEYMKQNYQNPDLTMSNLAEYLNISGVTLAVTFKNTMGISPSDYLAITRIEQAKILLMNTNMRVKEVSVAVGYEDDHVFIRRFKKYVGETPGQFRNENR